MATFGWGLFREHACMQVMRASLSGTVCLNAHKLVQQLRKLCCYLAAARLHLLYVT